MRQDENAPRRIAVIGAGAVGASMGARLARPGDELTLIDIWAEHVAAINSDGLVADGVPAPVRARPKALTPDGPLPRADLCLVAVDTNNTRAAADTAARILEPDGLALTVQNGIGNFELLVAALGPGRVIGGSTMCSFRTVGPGHVEQTYIGQTTLGELDGSLSTRIEALAERFRAAGYPTEVVADITRVVFEKLIVNVTINPITAITCLRMGELARLEATHQLQDLLLEEAFAVVRAKGIRVDEAGLVHKIKRHCRLKYSKPSMMQHVEAGKRTEIDALNGALVRIADEVGVPAPTHRAVTMLVKGVEAANIRRVHAPDTDWVALEAAAEAEETR
ncbi:MAG: 2-dehydropantoate 2-reductase [Geminicoccaceae bacterium]